MSTVSGLANMPTGVPDPVNLRLLSFLGNDMRKLGATCKKFDILNKNADVFKLISNPDFLKFVAKSLAEFNKNGGCPSSVPQASGLSGTQGLGAASVKREGEILRYRIRPNIYVDTTDVNFLKRVESDLKRLSSGEVGRRLITRISGGNHPIYISEGVVNMCASSDVEASRTRGVGCSSKITFSLKNALLVDSRGKAHFIPSFLALGHELIHGYNSSYGKNATDQPLSDCSRNWWTRREEIHAIRGFPSKNPSRKRPKISENAIREENGYPARFGHISGDAPKMQSPSFKLETQAQLVSDVFFRRIGNPYSSPPVVDVIPCSRPLNSTREGVYFDSHRITAFRRYYYEKPF